MDLSHLTLKEHLKGSILTDPFDYFVILNSEKLEKQDKVNKSIKVSWMR